MTAACQIAEHDHDVVVIGAGRAGLRATLAVTALGLRTACISTVLLARRHMAAAQGGVAAALGKMDDGGIWQYHMYDTVMGSDRLGDQDAIEYMCREAIPAVPELEQLGVPFTRIDNGNLCQRASGGQMLRCGEAMAQRTGGAADRWCSRPVVQQTAPAMPSCTPAPTRFSRSGRGNACTSGISGRSFAGIVMDVVNIRHRRATNSRQSCGANDLRLGRSPWRAGAWSGFAVEGSGSQPRT